MILARNMSLSRIQFPASNVQSLALNKYGADDKFFSKCRMGDGLQGGVRVALSSICKLASHTAFWKEHKNTLRNGGWFLFYRAYSIARISRMMFTFISPGNLSSCSMRFAISRAIFFASRSVTLSGVTNTRISRPA